MGVCQVTTPREGGGGGSGGGVRQTQFLFIQFTNCSVCICGKCKIARLPCDLAVHVKVGDDYKIVCILQAWEIKRLATTVRQQLPTGGCSSFFLLLFPPSLSACLSFHSISPLALSHFAHRKDYMNSSLSNKRNNSA